MKLSEILIAIICLSLIPIALFIWINNSIARASDVNIKSMTMNDYISIHSNTINDEQYYTTQFDDLDSNSMVDHTNDELNEFNDEEMVVDTNTRVQVSMNFVGDCTLGSDSNFGYKNTFFDVFDQNNDYAYFFSNMQDLFVNDDITVANLEGTFTNYTVKTPKEFNFRAPPEYANIILSGDVDAVNLANNHTKDYGIIGYEDTMSTLNEYGIPFFGYDNYYIYEKEGIKIGFVGLTAIWDGTINKRIDDAINYFHENSCNSIIFTFHWGIERNYQQNSTQQRVAHYAIDQGADLVVGHHPHVLQGIEKYKDKYIVYSLSNFCFGGNTNPPDKDTMVFNIKFDFENGILSNTTPKVYPTKVSSVNNRNDYKPTLATGEEYTRIMKKILRYSNISLEEIQ